MLIFGVVSDCMFFGQTETLQYLPVASALIVGGLTLTSFTLQNVGRSAQQFMSSVIWAGVTAGVMAVSHLWFANAIRQTRIAATAEAYTCSSWPMHHGEGCLVGLLGLIEDFKGAISPETSEKRDQVASKA
ncbi:hypothetical protein CMV_026662 [Castanea mollissima]|uniref:Uncharacterized protein n=1 Tax=Castanea mollissima TaxID=60419 RepID=A0A8J4VFP9_9ROSI|nr:hypothetical protein CMV_026662 [Castanea mollissima]